MGHVNLKLDMVVASAVHAPIKVLGDIDNKIHVLNFSFTVLVQVAQKKVIATGIH